MPECKIPARTRYKYNRCPTGLRWKNANATDLTESVCPPNEPAPISHIVWSKKKCDARS